MAHQRYPSIDPTREPHSLSLKVLRLSRPSLSRQTPLTKPTSAAHHDNLPVIMPASLASPSDVASTSASLFSPLASLPQSFGAAYIGETFSCTLCINHDALDPLLPPPPTAAVSTAGLSPDGSGREPRKKTIRNVRIEAEMKTPGTSATVHKLELLPPSNPPISPEDSGSTAATTAATTTTTTPQAAQGVDLAPGQTLQKIVSFDLREEGNHVLAVSVSYYEATETSGRARTFRKLYQFMCKSALVVRTKTGPLALGKAPGRSRRWVLEAQLENSGETPILLHSVGLDVEGQLLYDDCNWEVDSRDVEADENNDTQVEARAGKSRDQQL
ncbi:Trafficking protein particle complex subunit 13 [Ceratocystis platani]|uniref:Trafficking protein particle complex subunit 13 n=1 Tax=Ceratocystis fimbriata f. sp. platani TaxID=88771 RepID=A0A0F8B311_CERFI|nr:Trafficking protein particle complex subunit 13 [Ceratocystis platani]